MFQTKTVISNKFNSDNLKTNLAFLIKKYNLDNETLAKCTGVAPATLASLRSRSSNPTISTLQALADFFDLTIDQLVNQNCSLTTDQMHPTKISMSIPIIDVHLVPNWPFDWQSQNVHNLFYYVTTSNDLNSLCYAVLLNTEVLAPYYQKNTTLILDPNKKPQDSNIVLASINQQEPGFRQIFIDAGQYYFKPVNPEFGGMQSSQDCKIWGVVVRAIFEP